MIAPVIVWVVDTRMPSAEAVKSVTDPLVEAEKPWCGLSFVMRLPMVSMIRHPPVMVPSEMAM